MLIIQKNVCEAEGRSKFAFTLKLPKVVVLTFATNDKKKVCTSIYLPKKTYRSAFSYFVIMVHETMPQYWKAQN